MTAVHRRTILRTMLGSAAAVPAVSLIPDLAKSQQPAFGAGFNLAEASDLLYMCDQLYSPPDGVPMPAGFTQRWGSAPLFEPVIAFPPLDELWSLWQNNSVPSTYAIIARGTVGTSIGSVLEDLLSFLVQATGSVEVAGITIPYKFAADPNASVHAGFVLGTLLLLKVPVLGILAQLATRVPPGSNVYIAGHSQGAAVAALLSSYLYYDEDLKKNNYSYKTYQFAQPKPGDDHYDTDFGSVFCNKGLAFRLTNSLDFIPQLPFTWEIPTDLNITILASQAGLDSSLLATMSAQQRVAVESTVEKSKAHLQSTAQALARTQNSAVAVSASFTIPVVDSLYFVAAATEIALIGTPCTGAKCDFLYQHHTTTYNTLMQQQLSG
jgi:Lipase (class 3)